MKKTNKRKDYKTITKIDNNQFVKYNVNSLLSFTKFLDTKYPDWRWFNVYNNETKIQIANYTKNNRPTSNKVII